MKTPKKNSKNLLAKLSIFGLIAVSLSACVKDNSSLYVAPSAVVAVIQASPDEQPLDFYLNSNKVNSSPLTYGNSIDYFKANVGQRTANFYLTGTMNAVYSDTTTFAANNVYSVFLANKASSPQLVILKDTIAPPASGTASVRFVNLSPDAPAVDLVIKGGSTLVSNKAFKGFSSFLPVKGNTTYTLEVHQTGTSTVLATIAGEQLNNGFVYTVFFYGLATPANGTDGLTANILTNAYYN